MPKKNCSIDIFRYIGALMVMSIHIHPFEDISDFWGKEFRSVFPRIGVPFFFCAAGYFYIRKLMKGKDPFLPYMKRLLTTYFVWSCVYYLVDFLEWGKSDIRGFVKSCIYRFVVTGSHFHFWFFPALILAVIVVTILFKLRLQALVLPLSLALQVAGCLGASYYGIGSRIPVLDRIFLRDDYKLIRTLLFMGIPYFSAGYAVAKIENTKWYMGLKDSVKIAAMAAAVVFWRAEIYVVVKTGMSRSVVITPGLYLMLIVLMLFLISFPMYRWEKAADFCKTAAGFTYYIHPLFIWAIDKLSDQMHFVVTNTPRYALIWAATFLLALMIHKSNNKYLKMVCS